MSRTSLAAAVGLAVLMAPLAHGAVADPQIMTDHPVYRGELACSTLDRNIADAYRVLQDRYGHAPGSDTEKLLALWAWKSEHYMHAGSNRVYVGPDNPDANRTDDHLPWAGANGWERIEADSFEDIPIIYEITGSAGHTFWEKLGFHIADRHPHPALQNREQFVITLEQQAESVGISPERARDRLVMRLDLT